jgi:hypothetical protein
MNDVLTLNLTSAKPSDFDTSKPATHKQAI